jgi:hypothetical protein
MPKKTTKREADERCRLMLMAALPRLAKGRPVRFEDVRAVYQEPSVKEKTLKGRFTGDLKRLMRTHQSFSQMISPLGYFLPEFELEGNELKVAVRPFSRRLLSYGQDNLKEKLARRLVEEVFNHIPLVPRYGSLFLGYGTTLYFVAKEILARQRDSSELAVSTPNFEVAALFYLFAQHSARDTTNPLTLPGCTVNWTTGSMRHVEEPGIGTAIVGFDVLTKKGELFTDNSEEVTISNEAMESATERLIIVGDHEKIKRGGAGHKLTIPAATDHKEIFFVTDRPLPDGYRTPPDATLVVLNDSPAAVVDAKAAESESSDHAARSPRRQALPEQGTTHDSGDGPEDHDARRV